MRDLLVTAVVFGSLLLILRKPYIGILVWSWLSYMNPHRLGWGFAYSMPFAQIVAVTLFAAILFSKDREKFPINGTTITWILFMIWAVISTIFAVYFDSATTMLIKIFKIQIVTFLTVLLITNQERFNQLIWVIVLSIGFFSIKGGIFTVLTGGGHIVWGPSGSFIQENNSLALATLMVIPLMYYLYKITDHRWVKYFLLFAIASSLASSLGSQSRGALLAFIAIGVFFWWKSSNKIVTGFVGLIVIVLGLGFMPESWFDRMATIQTYEEDASAMGRLNAWEYSINIANARLTGGGLNSWSSSTFALYAPNPLDVHAAHSIYFGVLGDHGWPGLILFVLILLLTWKTTSKIIKKTAGVEEALQANTLARMLQVSLIAYMSGGAFLSLSYFDLPWHLVAFAVILKRMVDDAENSEENGKPSSSISVDSDKVNNRYRGGY